MTGAKSNGYPKASKSPFFFLWANLYRAIALIGEDINEETDLYGKIESDLEASLENMGRAKMLVQKLLDKKNEEEEKMGHGFGCC